MDEDGSLDLVLADSTGVRHFEYDGSAFVEKTGAGANIFSAVSGGHALKFVDVNRDGRLDLLVANSTLGMFYFTMSKVSAGAFVATNRR